MHGSQWSKRGYSSIMVLQQHNACLHIKYMHQFLNLKPHAFLSYSEKKLILMTVFGLDYILEEIRCCQAITQHKVSAFLLVCFRKQ